jgi:hypothetical protein
MGHRQKIYRQIAKVSAHRFDEANKKKGKHSLKKLTFCQRAR